MIKKKFDLNSDMIQIKENYKEEKIKIEMTKLTLYVPKKFSKEFKAWCVSNDVPMSTAIQDLFEKRNKNISN